MIADDQVAKQSEEDLRRAETFAFPLLFVLSLLFFRGLVAAALPLMLGGVAIVGALVVMRLLHEVIPLSVLSINVVTATRLRPRDRLLAVHRLPLPRGAGARRRYGGGAARTLRDLGARDRHSAASRSPARWRRCWSSRSSSSTRWASPASRWRCVCRLVGLVVLPAAAGAAGRRVNALSPGWLQRSRRATELPDEQGAGIGSRAGSCATRSGGDRRRGRPVWRWPSRHADRVRPRRRERAARGASAGAVDRAILADFPADPRTPIIGAARRQRGRAPTGLDAYRATSSRRSRESPPSPGPTQVGPGVDPDRPRSATAAATRPRPRSSCEEVREPPRADAGRGSAASPRRRSTRSASVASHIPLAALHPGARRRCCAVRDDRLGAAADQGADDERAHPGGGAGARGARLPGRQRLGGCSAFESQGGIQIGIAVLVVVGRLRAVDRLRRLQPLAGCASCATAGDNNEAVALGLERTGRLITSAALLFAVAMGALVTGGADRRPGDRLRGRRRGPDRRHDRARDAGAVADGAAGRPELVESRLCQTSGKRWRGCSPPGRSIRRILSGVKRSGRQRGEG